MENNTTSCGGAALETEGLSMMDGILMTLALLFLSAVFLVCRVVLYRSRADKRILDGFEEKPRAR